MKKAQQRIVQRLLPAFLLLLGCAAGVAVSDGHYHDSDGDGAEEHSPGYDQEQFLGKDAAKEFSQYDAKVSEKKLTELIKKEVDTDHDGFISEAELLKHLEKVHEEQQTEELDTHWKDLRTKDGKLDWATHAKTLQPNFFDKRSDETAEVAADAVEEAKKGVEVIALEIPKKVPEDDQEILREFFKDLVRQRKRWTAADSDKDGSLTKEEYRAMLFPEDVPAMRDVVVAETLSQMDSNGDGRLSLDEYLAGQWTPRTPGEKEPSWLAEERDSFAKKDANRDGFLDRGEVHAWIQPPGLASAETVAQEAGHLIREADDNRDGRLSTEEVLKHRDLFAGSKATRYGSNVYDGLDRDEL